jgi:hypothetical protein
MLGLPYTIWLPYTIFRKLTFLEKSLCWNFLSKTYLIPLSKGQKIHFLGKQFSPYTAKLSGGKSDTIPYEAGNIQGITHGCTVHR